MSASALGAFVYYGAVVIVVAVVFWIASRKD